MNHAFKYHVAMAIQELECALEECDDTLAEEHRVPEDEGEAVKEAVFILSGII